MKPVSTKVIFALQRWHNSYIWSGISVYLLFNAVHHWHKCIYDITVARSFRPADILQNGTKLT